MFHSFLLLLKMKAVVIIFLFFICLIAIHIHINSKVELSPYMDEIFHIPQAMLYCQGRLSEWDPKITTFPGLYLVSAVFHWVVRLTPSVASLRLCNVFITTALFVTLILYRRKIIGRNHSDDDSILISLLLICSPLILFYTFLYYTDTLSLLLVVMMGLVSRDMRSSTHTGSSKKSVAYIDLNKGSILRLLMVSGSILSRQTNVVWAVFFAGTYSLAVLRSLGAYNDGQEVLLSLPSVQKLINSIYKHHKSLLLILWPYLLPVTAFILFATYNGSIVLGDKDNHSMVLHLAMPLHAFALAILFTLPVLLIHVLSAVVKVAYTLVHLIFLNDSSAADKLSILNSLCTEMLLHPFMVIDSNSNNSSVRSSTNSKLHSSPERPKTRSMMKKEQKQQVTSGQQLTTICLLFIGHFIGLAIVTVCLVRYSYSHPFLLADNRHYTFYVWKRLLQYPKIRALLGLPYYVTVLVLFSRLRRVQGPLWVTGFMIASCLSLVPTPLLEPRYFTQVVVLALLHSPPTVNTPVVTLWGVKITPRHMLQLSVIGSVSLSILLLYVFLYRPFLWPDGSVARFMP